MPRPVPRGGPAAPVGVAGYLNTETGAGPTEVAALTFDPPVPFRWATPPSRPSAPWSAWLRGADVGVGTLAVVVVLGPGIDVLPMRLPRWEVSSPV